MRWCDRKTPVLIRNGWVLGAPYCPSANHCIGHPFGLHIGHSRGFSNYLGRPIDYYVIGAGMMTTRVLDPSSRLPSRDCPTTGGGSHLRLRGNLLSLGVRRSEAAAGVKSPEITTKSKSNDR